MFNAAIQAAAIQRLGSNPFPYDDILISSGASRPHASQTSATHPACASGDDFGHRRQCVPERVVDNAFFSRELGIDTTPEWIEQRIGIVSRHWAVNESSTDLAVGAARSALESGAARSERH